MMTFHPTWPDDRHMFFLTLALAQPYVPYPLSLLYTLSVCMCVCDTDKGEAETQLLLDAEQ